MKAATAFAVALVLFAVMSVTCVFAVHVRGYYRKDGRYVAPHERTAPNKTKNDNYSTRGNVNPYTGKSGTKPRDSAAATPQRAGIASGVGPTKNVGSIWGQIKHGMSLTELRSTLGNPTSSERIGSYDIWRYSDGTVLVGDGKVIAWKQATGK